MHGHDPVADGGAGDAADQPPPHAALSRLAPHDHGKREREQGDEVDEEYGGQHRVARGEARDHHEVDAECGDHGTQQQRVDDALHRHAGERAPREHHARGEQTHRTERAEVERRR